MPTHSANTNIFEPAPIRDASISVRFSADELSVADEYAARYGVSRADFIRLAVGRLIASTPDSCDRA